MLRPKNVRKVSETSLLSSLCPYCLNIRLKLQKLNIPGLNMEYHLFNKLICNKESKIMLEDEPCISKECKKCSDWESTIETVLSSVDQDRNITWYTWQKEEITRKNGKKGINRDLVCKTRPFNDFKAELINDILHPTQRVTFVEHYMTQKIQLKVYNECYNFLKPGQCLIVQDFAKNRDIVYQDEIKANYWVKKQVTMHPTVLFYRLTEGEEVCRLVITHLGDITNHDAHLVHYMTLDCIKILNEKHPGIEWTKFFIWSDGCAAQYKGKISFYYLDKFPVVVERNFFGSEHGKGPSDAETGLISMKLSTAIKSRQAIIQNASDMHKFLTKDKEDDSRIFQLINQDDFQSFMNEFDGIMVNTLAGNCTRSLHQIKASEEKGFLMQRPFSCYCINCTAEDFEKCINKSFTKGNFKKHKLPSNEVHGNGDENHIEEDNEEENEEIIQENLRVILQEDKEDGEEMEIIQENLLLSDLVQGNYVIVSIPVEIQKKKCKITLRYYVAKITNIEDEEEIIIDYLQQDFDYDQKFRNPIENDVGKGTELSKIVMVLQDPDKIRGGVIFPRIVNLKKFEKKMNMNL